MEKHLGIFKIIIITNLLIIYENFAYITLIIRFTGYQKLLLSEAGSELA